MRNPVCHDLSWAIDLEKACRIGRFRAYKEDFLITVGQTWKFAAVDANRPAVNSHI